MKKHKTKLPDPPFAIPEKFYENLEEKNRRFMQKKWEDHKNAIFGDYADEIV